MSKNVIFCYSGSGNCLDIAKNIARGLGDTDIIMMRSRPVITNVRNAERVGFVFPCYAGGLPGDVEEYLHLLYVPRRTYTFGVVSYSGYPGTGLAKLNAIIPLNYHAGISHRCSCIWLLPPGVMMPILTPEKAQKRSEELAAKIAEDVRNGVESEKKPSSPLWNRLESKAWPKLAEIKAKQMSVSAQCIGCGQCEKLCPKGNIRLEGGRPVFGTSCIQCLSCLQYCPKEAIHLGGITEKRQRFHNQNVTPAELMQSVIHVDTRLP